MKIITIGGSGLVGSRVNEILSQKYQIKDLSRSSGLDITQPETLNNLIINDSNLIILYAAKADVDGCEKDKDLGERGEAYQINVTGIQNIVNSAKKSGKKIIHISTDFVFDGSNTPKNGYSEEDTPNPLNWYARTKYLGEEIIRNYGLPFIIARISYPYKNINTLKKDFPHVILSRLQNNLPVKAVTDHIMTPTYIDDIAHALDTLITENKEGMYHITGSQSLSPYEAAISIADKFNLDKSLITKTTRAEFFQNRATRPFNLTMNNAKIQQLGVKMRGFEQSLREIII